ncbi:MAG: hypothetical protein WB791_07655 [Waddliaceae bacterium]
MTIKHNPSFISFAKEGIRKEIIAPHLSKATTVFSHKSKVYSELFLFKQQIEVKQNLPYLRPFTSNKAMMILYRFVFLGLAVLYLILGLILYSKPFSWSCSFLFGNCSLLKTFLCTSCVLASSALFMLGLVMKPERELLKKTFRRAKRMLKRKHNQKLLKYHVKRYFLFGEEYRKTLAFKQFYQESLEKLYDCLEETDQLLSHVARSSPLESHMKEELYNQALLECSDKMSRTVNTFTSKNPPQYILHLIDPFLMQAAPSAHSGFRPTSPLHNESRDDTLIRDSR